MFSVTPLCVSDFGSEAAEKRTYDIVEVTLQNVHTNKHIKIQAVVIDSITSARIRIPSKFIRNIALERGIELADNSTAERIHVFIGSDYISETLGEKNIRISKRLIAVDSIFGYLIQGKEDEVNCKNIFANHLIVNEEFDFDRVRNLWSLETIGINPDNEVPLSDKEILKTFEQNTVYTKKRYETRLLWKEDSRAVLLKLSILAPPFSITIFIAPPLYINNVLNGIIMHFDAKATIGDLNYKPYKLVT
ncbi:DUF1758 domain-containing protein [Trichonephila clavipes]|nr:DUF1758 domain-containing protein [Trichonephila clavipes]